MKKHDVSMIMTKHNLIKKTNKEYILTVSLLKLKIYQQFSCVKRLHLSNKMYKCNYYSMRKAKIIQKIVRNSARVQSAYLVDDLNIYFIINFILYNFPNLNIANTVNNQLKSMRRIFVYKKI